MTVLPLPRTPAATSPVRGLGPALLVLAAAVAMPLAVATASPHAYDAVVESVLLLMAFGIPPYLVLPAHESVGSMQNDPRTARVLISLLASLELRSALADVAIDRHTGVSIVYKKLAPPADLNEKRRRRRLSKSQQRSRRTPGTTAPLLSADRRRGAAR